MCAIIIQTKLIDGHVCPGVPGPTPFLFPGIGSFDGDWYSSKATSSKPQNESRTTDEESEFPEGADHVLRPGYEPDSSEN